MVFSSLTDPGNNSILWQVQPGSSLVVGKQLARRQELLKAGAEYLCMWAIQCLQDSSCFRNLLQGSALPHTPCQGTLRTNGRLCST